ncbi:MAG: M23 family metallopeptidase [Pseudomonadota bacterium]
MGRRSNFHFPAKAFFLLIVIGGFAALAFKFEFFGPDLTVSPEFKTLGREKPITVRAQDTASGLREISVSLIQKGKEVCVHKQIFSKPSFLSRGTTRKYASDVVLRPLALGQEQGETLLRVSARDYSWWGFFSGNRRVVEKKLVIDTRPPSVSLLSTSHILSLGGSGLVIYHVDNDVVVSGVMVGKRFYRGYPKPNGPKGTYMAYFAMPLEASEDFKLMLTAKDQSGNTAWSGVPNLIKYKKFRSDKIELSQNFLQTKMPELMQYHPDLKGSHEEVFVQVNHKLREKNDKRVTEICSVSEAKPLWEGTFLRMQNAAPKALFGDQRTYVHQGRDLDHVVHLGVDLASNEHAPIQAANGGIVAFTGYLGIYGNTVVLDHGQGIFTMYAHLNSIKVPVRQAVQKGAILGYSGSTGLAGGDHLHFGMIVGGTFVNPIEWWDEHWIKDNVLLKLQ